MARVHTVIAAARAHARQIHESLAALEQLQEEIDSNGGGAWLEGGIVGVNDDITAAQVSTHDKNAEIPGLIAEGKGDVMITETYEALHYARTDPRLYAAFIDAPLTPVNTLGFMAPTDDADYLRVLRFAWELVDSRGAVREAAAKWLK